jgi:hypothetical protein
MSDNHRIIIVRIMLRQQAALHQSFEESRRALQPQPRSCGGMTQRVCGGPRPQRRSERRNCDLLPLG